jgi:hypothetical protein
MSKLLINNLYIYRRFKMAQILINENGVISLGSIDGEEDLKLKPGMNINPPPEDGRCNCCGRHISELKPFGGPGDPLVGDFTGAYLVKKWRPSGPYDKKAEVAAKEAYECYSKDGFEDPLDWMVKKYGKNKGEWLYYTDMMYNQIGSSWECRDCCALNTNEYYEKIEQRDKTLN